MELNLYDVSDEDFVKSVQNEVLGENIYVYTPKGDVFELPKGATPIDFAYRVHTKIGETMVGAIVNDNIVPLDYELHTGDIVNIKTNKNSKPSQEWLSIVKSSQTKNKIRAFFSKIDKKEVKAIAVNMIKAVGLDESIYKKLPKELSGGMKQRCAIAQAFSIDPPILLMDEPFGALDAVTRARLQDLVRELWTRDEKKKTVFFVTHDVDEALLLANRILVLGQSPSHIIYDVKITEELHPTRDTLFENIDMMKLRITLINQINKDVTTHI